MASKLVTDVLGLTKYSEVDMPEDLNVLSDDMDIIDSYAGSVNAWKDNTDATIAQMQSDISVLQPEVITALENKVTTNAINIANLTTDISELRRRANFADNRLDVIEAEQIEQNDDIDAIKAEQIVQNNAIDALGNDINTLQTEVTSYETETDERLVTIESDITNLKIEDETITAQLAVDAAELADHEERISALEGGTGSTIPQRVTDLETEVGVLDSAVAGLNTDMDAAEAAIGTLTTSVGTLQSDMTTAQGDIGTLQTSMTSAEGNISTLQSDLSTLSTSVTDYSVEAKTLKTESSGQTYATQLNKLYNYMVGLSTEQRMRSALVITDNANSSYRLIPFNSKNGYTFVFSAVDNETLSGTGITINNFFMNSGNASVAHQCYMDSNGVSVTDISNTTNSLRMNLILI